MIGFIQQSKAVLSKSSWGNSTSRGRLLYSASGELTGLRVRIMAHLSHQGRVPRALGTTSRVV